MLDRGLFLVIMVILFAHTFDARERNIPLTANDGDLSLMIIYIEESAGTDNRSLKRCHDSEFQCKITRKCIQRDLVKNGRNNCGENDTSDETEPLFRCSEDEFRCRYNGQCIRRVHANRYIGLCHDKSDSDGVEGLPCRIGTDFRCPHGQCISRKYVQSRNKECEINGFDEKTTLVCNEAEYRCPESGRCIPRRKVRDGLPDCPTGADEGIKSILRNCGPATGEYQCPGKMKRCIPRWKVGDGRPDCEHRNSPEEAFGVLGSCLETEFSCVARTAGGDRVTIRCLPRTWVNDGVAQCPEGSDERGQSLACKPAEHSCDFGTRCLTPDKVCDGVVDCQDCSDETNTSICTKNETANYFMCSNSLGLLGENLTSEGIRNSHCILRSYFCDGNIDCADGSDGEKVGTGMKCRISRKQFQEFVPRVCVLPQSLFNDGKIDCDDASDEDGQRVVEEKISCPTRITDLEDGRKHHETIFKKQFCDGVFDCSDLTDECLCPTRQGNSPRRAASADICENICYGLASQNGEITPSNSKIYPCQFCPTGFMLCDSTENKTGNNILRCIEVSKICDGSADCSDGMDEWYCLHHTRSGNKSETIEFTEMVCPHPYLTQRYPELSPTAKVCDGNPECLGLVDECIVHEGFKFGAVHSASKCGKLSRVPSYCRVAGQMMCDNGSLPILPSQICDGVSHCTDGSDENYCEDTRFMCNVIASTPVSKYAHSKSLSKGRVSILKGQVCDEYVDCSGAIDEQDCPGHFYCRNGKSPVFVRKDKILDGFRDCSDGSDECPDPDMFEDDPLSSNRDLIASPLIRMWLYIITVFAVLGNTTVIVSRIRLLKSLNLPNCLSGISCGRSHGKVSALSQCNNIMVLNLAIADLLTGIYLVILVWKTTEFSGSYCSHGVEWRSSQACDNLGTMMLVSGLSSLFLLTALTSYRLYAVLRPWKTRNLRPGWAVCFTSCSWLFSVTLALLPRLPFLQETLVTAVWLASTDGSHFLHFPHAAVDKYTMRNFIRKVCVLTGTWPRNATDSSKVCSEVDSASWNSLSHATGEILSTSWIKGKFGFYSAHGVCMPSLFAEGGGNYVFSYASVITTTIFVPCLYIILAYTTVSLRAGSRQSSIRKTKHVGLRSSSEVTQTATTALTTFGVQPLRNAALQQRNMAKPKYYERESRVSTMNKRITRVVCTNCLCWMPLCIIAYAGQLGVTIPHWLYAFSAVVLLPINSAINPMIYSEAVQKGVKKLCKMVARSWRHMQANNNNNNTSELRRKDDQQLDHHCKNAAVDPTERDTSDDAHTALRPTTIRLPSNSAPDAEMSAASISARSRWSRLSRLFGSMSSGARKDSSSSKHDANSSEDTHLKDEYESIAMKTVNTLVTPEGEAKRSASITSARSMSSTECEEESGRLCEVKKYNE